MAHFPRQQPGQHHRRQHEPYREHRSGGLGRFGSVTAVIIVIALLSFGLLWRAHQRAKFHQLTASVIPPTTSVPMPGGQEAILLSRVALANNAESEFTSATVLPGVGMQLLQATVAGPDVPSQDLFVSLPVSDAARMPPNSVANAPFHIRVSSKHLQEKGGGDDLISFLPATDAQNQTLVDGGEATGSFPAPEKSGVAAEIDITLSGRQIDLIGRVINQTAENRFVSFEWAPRFLAPDGNLANLGLSVPSRGLAGAGTRSGNSSDAGTGFSSEAGQPVGQRALDLRFSRLSHDSLSDGTFVRLNYRDRFYIRVLGMGDTLRSAHATTDPSTHSLLLSLSSLDLAADPEQRDQTLRPHQTMQWHLRIEVLPVKPPQTPDSAR